MTPDAGTVERHCHPLELGSDFGLPWMSICGQPCGTEIVHLDDGFRGALRFKYSGERLTEVLEKRADGSWASDLSYILDDAGTPKSVKQGAGNPVPMSWSSPWRIDSIGVRDDWLTRFVRDSDRLVRVDETYNGELTKRTSFLYENGAISSVETDDHADGRIDERLTFSRESSWDAIRIDDQWPGDGSLTRYVSFRPDGFIDRVELEWQQGHLNDSMYKNKSGAIVQTYAQFKYEGCE